MIPSLEVTRIWGVVGGMGPMASAEFLRTIYGLWQGPEQDAPIVFLDSDPTFPDRTEHVRSGRQATLARRLERSLARLVALGASDIVICCVTMHAVLPLVEQPLRQVVTSLPQVALDDLAACDGRYLLLCTEGTREARVFQSQPQWRNVSGRCMLLDPDDQRRVHELIYAVKRNADPTGAAAGADALRRKYGATGLVAGCTEMHLLARREHSDDRFPWIDPLTTIARRICAAQLPVEQV